MYTVEAREELDQFVSSPKVNVYYYGTVANNSRVPYTSYSGRLETIKAEVIVYVVFFKWIYSYYIISPLLVVLLIYILNLVQCMLTLITTIDDHSALKNTKKALQRLHGNLGFCLENLGLWGALHVSFHGISPFPCIYTFMQWNPLL